MSDRPDHALVEAVLAGDTGAFAVLVARYRRRYARFATRMLGDSHEAEEAMQDAFVRAWRALGRCRNPERFDLWFFRILANRCRSAGARRGHRERRIVADEQAMHRAAAPPSVEGSAWREEIERALAALPTDQREAFLLRHVEGMDYEEMVELTGAGVSALKMRVKRACDRLRLLLGEVNDVR